MKTGVIAAGAAAGVIAIVGGTWAWTVMQGGELADCVQGQVAGGDLGGPFTLVSETGETVTDEDVVTEPTLLYFGYTFCPDVCPLDSARNAQALDLLQEQGIDAKAAFVTVDPARDTVEVVDRYTENFHEDMIGLTGSPEQVKEAADAYRVYYQAQEAEDDYYLVDHTAFTYLVMPEEGFVTFFRRDATPEAVAESTQCVVETLN
ncbi:SCO family protein [Histidinibacterium aquaticum]|uniref:SCO family protein n=1 Tax=Histidinibacterium aquaticum TaxID=2613962 RepID=A0A5J5GFL6_9RHOB|nr:SCO family protein [Histidinibacterium aquaticum]KAA9006800.1 SCO family protein [Histidinibacterium aquaticum]